MNVEPDGSATSVSSWYQTVLGLFEPDRGKEVSKGRWNCALCRVEVEWEERSFRVSESRGRMPGGWGELCSEDYHCLHPSPNVTRVIKSSRTG